MLLLVLSIERFPANMSAGDEVLRAICLTLVWCVDQAIWRGIRAEGRK